MVLRHSPPITILLTGFGWLVLSSILGLAMLVGMVRETPLPPWVRALHVHATLVGGVVPIILGGLLALSHSLGSSPLKNRGVHPLTYWALNGGLVGMLVGFWLHQSILVGAAGLVIMGAFLALMYTIWIQAKQNEACSIRPSWYDGLAFIGLLGGVICGGILALRLAPESYGHLRLAHIHSILLGFIVLTVIGIASQILPRVWNRPLFSSQLQNITILLMPIGLIVLMGGFLNSFVPLEMTAGVMLVIALSLFVGNLLKTWLSSAHNGSAASDHLMIGVFFLLFTIVLGILIGVNNLSSPPALPYGKLHLAVYTHMAFVGFLMNAVMGLFSYLIPLTLAAARVTSIKKRGAYVEQLTAIMDRGRTIQISTLGLGMMGLGILAALTWNVPFTSISIQVATWTCFGLLLTSLVLFSVKLATVWSKQPETLATTQIPPHELKLTA